MGTHLGVVSMKLSLLVRYSCTVLNTAVMAGGNLICMHLCVCVCVSIRPLLSWFIQLSVHHPSIVLSHSGNIFPIAEPIA